MTLVRHLCSGVDRFRWWTKAVHRLHSRKVLIIAKLAEGWLNNESPQQETACTARKAK